MSSAHQTRKQSPLANVLGWSSLGLGVPMVTSPGRFLDAIGVKEDATTRTVALGVGLQEHAAAAGILAIERPRPVISLWSRVAGDLTHLGLLAAAWRNKRDDDTRLVAAMASVVAIGALDLTAALRFTRNDEVQMEDSLMQVRTATTVRAPRDEVYGYWRDFENFPVFMFHLESVEATSDTRSHWKAKGPAGKTIEWDAEITEDRPGEVIAWRSLDGATIQNSGRVRFTPAPGDRGTEIHLELDARLPGGKAGELAGKLFGAEPTQQAKDDLRRFKQVMETGEVVRSDGSPEGQNARRHLKQRPAKPPEEAVADATAPSAGRTS